MQRVMTPTAVPEKPAYGATGTPGFFRSGDPVQGLPATVPGQDWFNRVQEELANAVLQAGIDLDPADDTQLYQAFLEFLALHNSSAESHPDIRALIAAMTGGTVDEFFVGAGAMSPSITDGATLGVVEDATNHLSRNVMIFKSTDADTKAIMGFRLPSNWNRGPIKGKVLWTPAAGASAGNQVRFQLAGVAVGDDDALDVALGSAVNIDDAVLAVGDVHISGPSAAMTIAGTPQVGDYLRLVLSRDYNYGSPALTVDAQVLGLVLQYGITGNISAW